jgi:hypothetical protein
MSVLSLKCAVLSSRQHSSSIASRSCELVGTWHRNGGKNSGSSQTPVCSFCILLRGGDESSSFTRGGPGETEARDYGSHRRSLDLAFASLVLKFNKP